MLMVHRFECGGALEYHFEKSVTVAFPSRGPADSEFLDFARAFDSVNYRLLRCNWGVYGVYSKIKSNFSICVHILGAQVLFYRPVYDG